MTTDKPFLQRIAELDAAAKARGLAGVLPEGYEIRSAYGSDPASLWHKWGDYAEDEVLAIAACTHWLSEWCRTHDPMTSPPSWPTANYLLAWADEIVASQPGASPCA